MLRDNEYVASGALCMQIKAKFTQYTELHSIWISKECSGLVAFVTVMLKAPLGVWLSCSDA